MMLRYRLITAGTLMTLQLLMVVMVMMMEMIVIMILRRMMMLMVLRIVERLSVTRTRTLLRRSCLLKLLLLRMAASHFPC